MAEQLQHSVAIHDDQSVIKLATAVCGVHVLKDTAVKRTPW